MIGSNLRRPAAIAIVVATLLAPRAEALFLDMLICEMDPVYDRCLAGRLSDFAEEVMPQGAARDQALIAAFAGRHFSSRTEAEQAYVPDPAYYRDAATTDLGDAIITMIDLVLHEEDYEAAATLLDAMEPGTGRLMALRYLAEAHLRFGDPAMGRELADRFAEDIAAVSSPQSRLGYLPDLSWLYVLAGDNDAALATVEEIVAIAQTHPIEQLRPVFGIPAGLGEGIALGPPAGAARIEAGLDSLESMIGVPITFVAETYAAAAEAYGRLGFESEARAAAGNALDLIGQADYDRRWHILRDLMEAGIPY